MSEEARQSSADELEGEPESETPKAREKKDSESFTEWLVRPQTMIALAAVLLSLCGLFISLYEMSLIRRQQRASVWPHVEVAPKLNAEGVTLTVQNTGVGPARILAARLSLTGVEITNWSQLIRSLGFETDSVDWSQSLISVRVLPPNSTREVAFEVKREESEINPKLASVLQREILEGRLDVELCYCSVYEECWTTSMQDFVKRFRGLEIPRGTREVESCEEMEVSGI